MAPALYVDLNENVRISTNVIIYRKCVPNYDCVMPFVYMYIFISSFHSRKKTVQLMFLLIFSSPILNKVLSYLILSYLILSYLILSYDKL